MIVNISGRGGKDMATAGKWFGYLTDDQAAALDVATTPAILSPGQEEEIFDYDQ